MFPTLISRLFDPFLLLLVSVSFAAYRSGIEGSAFVTFFLFLLFGIVAPLFFLLVWATKTKQVSNYDLSKRQERVRALLILFPFLIADIIGIAIFFPKLLTFFILIFFLLFGFFLITLKWKISGHIICATFTIGLLLLWYGMRLWPILLFLPLIAWARLELKRHTMGEVIGGVVYAVVIFSIAHLLQLI